jgi:hypothetical protein
LNESVGFIVKDGKELDVCDVQIVPLILSSDEYVVLTEGVELGVCDVLTVLLLLGWLVYVVVVLEVWETLAVSLPTKLGLDCPEVLNVTRGDPDWLRQLLDVLDVIGELDTLTQYVEVLDTIGERDWLTEIVGVFELVVELDVVFVATTVLDPLILNV